MLVQQPSISGLPHHHWMPIYGRYHAKETVERGVFQCPACDKERSFKHKNVAMKSHWCWIPCGEGKQTGEYIKCCSCKAHFPVTVLNDPLDQEIHDKQHEHVQDETHNTETEQPFETRQK